MDDSLAYFLALRLQMRGRPAALALVDRCLRLLARAQAPDISEMVRLEAEIDDLRAELEARFGPARRLKVH